MQSSSSSRRTRWRQRCKEARDLLVEEIAGSGDARSVAPLDASHRRFDSNEQLLATLPPERSECGPLLLEKGGIDVETARKEFLRSTQHLRRSKAGLTLLQRSVSLKH